eukprot:685519-Prorocentrum_lima.AAC.1
MPVIKEGKDWIEDEEDLARAWKKFWTKRDDEAEEEKQAKEAQQGKDRKEASWMEVLPTKEEIWHATKQ